MFARNTLPFILAAVGSLCAEPPSEPFLPSAETTILDGVAPRRHPGLFVDLDAALAADAPRPIVLRTDFDVWSDGAPLLTSGIAERSAEGWTDRGFRHDGLKRVAKSKTDLDWGTHSSKIELRERDLGLLDPAGKQSWETGEKLNMPVAGPLFAFAQLDASSPSVEQQQHKWLGKYGVGVKIKPWLLDEVQFRGGPAVRYDDTGKPLRGNSAERSEVFVEAATKLPLPVLGALELEWTGYAIPAASTADRSVVNQDLRLAKPLGGGSEVYLGAKYRWEDAPGATPWVDRMQVYMGLQLKR